MNAIDMVETLNLTQINPLECLDVHTICIWPTILFSEVILLYFCCVTCVGGDLYGVSDTHSS